MIQVGNLPFNPALVEIPIPSPVEFITTEDSLFNISTEDNVPLVTEG